MDSAAQSVPGDLCGGGGRKPVSRWSPHLRYLAQGHGGLGSPRKCHCLLVSQRMGWDLGVVLRVGSGEYLKIPGWGVLGVHHGETLGEGKKQGHRGH